MAVLTKKQVALSGLDFTTGYVAAAGGGDQVVPGDRTYLHVKNAGGSPITVTIDDPNSVGPTSASAFNPDPVVTVPATTGERFIGPLGATRFANPGTGNVHITYSAVTSVTVAAYSL